MPFPSVRATEKQRKGGFTRGPERHRAEVSRVSNEGRTYRDRVDAIENSTFSDGFDSLPSEAL